MFDWTISVGNVIQMAMVVGGAVVMYFGMRNDINLLRTEVNYIQEKMAHLAAAFDKLGTILTQVAVQDHKMLMLEERLDRIQFDKSYQHYLIHQDAKKELNS